jgi:hypothetical protein
MKNDRPPMSRARHRRTLPAEARLVTELLLLPTEEVLVHNLTPTFARLLAELGLSDGGLRLRPDTSTDRSFISYPAELGEPS